MKTKVLFRMFEGEVTALMPALAATSNPYLCTCYAHVGQHSAADPQLVIRRSRRATPKEYRALATELRRRGYKLDIRKRTTQKDLQERKKQLA